MKNRLKLPLLASTIVFALAASAADRSALDFTFSKTDVPGAQETGPAGINNAGVIVGWYMDSYENVHGYILNGKKLTKLDDPKGEGTTFANGLNPNGPVWVVGSYTSSETGKSVGFLYKEGKYTDIFGPNGAVQSTAGAINDSGAIVGAYLDSANVEHGFLLKDNAYTTLNVPGAISTWATGINNRGEVVLFWANPKLAYGSSLYDGHVYKTVNVPGASSSYAMGINTAGDVCYGWFDSAGVEHGALLHAGKFYKFDYPNSGATYGSGTNDKGNVVGAYHTRRRTYWHGFKASTNKLLIF
jgi:uncharacterized membrane protein